MRKSTPDDFWAKVAIAKPGDCWPWVGGKFSSGYGQVGSSVLPESRSHRLAWHLTYGPIPAGIQICHSCDNPICCNPSHLFQGSSLDNMRDKCKKGRQARGEKQHLAVATVETVLAIRQEYKPRSKHANRRAIAQKYGVSMSTVYDICSRRTWKHV